ncbi:MAG: hypothetical protein AAF961_04290 [Planctomycetota bacterium]
MDSLGGTVAALKADLCSELAGVTLAGDRHNVLARIDRRSTGRAAV